MKSIIGLIGGMGAYAGAALFFEMLKACNTEKDQDFIELIVHSNPMIPDRTAHLLHGGQSPVKELLRSVRILEDAGATEIVIGCITAYAYFDDLQREVNSAKIINVPEIVADFIKNQMPHVRKIGVLCSEGASKMGIWEKAFAGSGITPGYLSDTGQKELFNNVIYGSRSVKAGVFDDANRSKLEEAVQRLKEDGADIVLGSCSELPLVLSHRYTADYLDATSIGIRFLIDKCQQR